VGTDRCREIKEIRGQEPGLKTCRGRNLTRVEGVWVTLLLGKKSVVGTSQGKKKKKVGRKSPINWRAGIVCKDSEDSQKASDLVKGRDHHHEEATLQRKGEERLGETVPQIVKGSARK